MSIPEDQDRAEPGFLADLPLTHPHRERSWLGAIVSLALHLAAVLALLTIAYLSPMTLPGQGDSQRVSLYYNPPPAPPLPLPKGTLNAPKTDPL
ncbi:MAG: hypothetical protein MUF51_03310, partial [Vicinamibacteria bacterium]|nr:hypothetical protein [Vicinamibacteria bacterium]